MQNNQSKALSRLKRDYLQIKENPDPNFDVEPLPTNLFEWHYVIKGPKFTPYYGGYYHGKIIFSHDYPLKPPSIYMLTPNGRFATDVAIFMFILSLHPGTWNPAWTVSGVLTAFLNFMLTSTPTFGSIDATFEEKQRFARESLNYNLQNEIFCDLFPEICYEIYQNVTGFSLNCPAS